jgi:protein-S-isoprenylcysteine O-methyltransferase Ste14
MPLVTEGAYQWTPHAMYVLVFLALWAFAFLAGSLAALSLAIFEHAYVWVHYFFTEKPDMDLMYEGSS